MKYLKRLVFSSVIILFIFYKLSNIEPISKRGYSGPGGTFGSQNKKSYKVNILRGSMDTLLIQGDTVFKKEIPFSNKINFILRDSFSKGNKIFVYFEKDSIRFLLRNSSWGGLRKFKRKHRNLLGN